MYTVEQATSSIKAVYRSALERARRHGAISGGNTTPRDPESTGARRATAIDRTSPDYELLRSESARLSTFDDWPASHVVQPSALARAGFFYMGEADRTQCAFCRGVLHSWQPGDVPDVEHRRHFPDCRLVRQLDVGNVTLDRQMASLGVGGDVIGDVSHAGCTSGDPGNSAVSSVGATSPHRRSPTDALPPESSVNSRHQGDGRRQTAEAGNDSVTELPTTQTTTHAANALGKCAITTLSINTARIVYAEQGLYGTVHPPVPSFGRRTPPAGDIDRLLHDRRSAANASSVTLSADVGGWTQTCCC